jgi:hypothetical protein
MAAVFLLYFGLGWGVRLSQLELDVNRLWVDEWSNLPKQYAFFRSNFELFGVNSFIITTRSVDGDVIPVVPDGANISQAAAAAKTSPALLSPEVLAEVEDLQRWMLEFSTLDPVTRAPLTLDSLCYKTLDDKPEQPCLQLSILDCFGEGRAFVHGGGNNSVYYGTYGSRRSYRDFDFSRELTEDYLRDQCKFWYNLQSPWRMFIGGVEFQASEGPISSSGGGGGGGGAGGTRSPRRVRDALALQVTFGLKVPKDLARRGLQYVAWGETPRTVERDVMGCTPAEAEQCDVCVPRFDFVSALRADVGETGRKKRYIYILSFPFFFFFTLQI